MFDAVHSGMARVALSLCVLACLLAPVRATTIEQLSLDEMILKSTAIVRGRVLGSQAALHNGLIYTHHSVQVLERWKGPTQATVDVVVPGGRAKGLRQSFSGIPELTEGAEYLLFLWTGKSGLTHVIGLSQGALGLARNSNGEVVVGRSASNSVMLDARTGKQVADAAFLMRLREISDRITRTLARGARQ
jgi:hypothetical protein